MEVYVLFREQNCYHTNKLQSSKINYTAQRSKLGCELELHTGEFVLLQDYSKINHSTPGELYTEIEIDNLTTKGDYV